MSEIAVVTPDQAPAIYVKGGLAPFMERIRAEVVPEVPDLTTKAGRERIASRAHQISRSKTAVEKPGREYLKHIKETMIKDIEAELRWWATECDALRDQIRQPLTDMENAEKARIAAHNAAIDAVLAFAAEPFQTSDQVQLAIDYVGTTHYGEECEEFLQQYATAQNDTLAALAARYAQLVAHEQGAALREAQAVAAAVENERAASALREARAAEDALAAERRRIAQAEQEEAQRAANVEHQRAINAAILAKLVALGASEELGRAIITAAVRGEAGALCVRY